MRHRHSFSWVLVLVAVACAAVSDVCAAPSSDYPLEVVVTGPGSLDTMRFADHTGVLGEGNWIVLSGGTNVTLPAITLSYDGVTGASYQRGGYTIVIQTMNLDGRTVTYPLANHSVYAPTDTIWYSYWGDVDLAGSVVSVRVIPVDATDFRDAASDAFLGDTALMKSILGSATLTQPKTLDGSGDIAATSLGALGAGDYLLVIVREVTGNPYSLDVYSATPIEVLDYASTLDHPSSVKEGSDLPVTVQLAGAGAASRRYGAVMIQKARYNANLALTSDGSTEGTELTVRGAVLVQGTAEGFSIAGVGLDGLDKDELVDTLNEAYGGSEFSVAFSGYTANTQQAVTLTTSGLNSGEYVLLVGVWDGGGNKLVAFKQAEVTLTRSTIISITTRVQLIESMTNADAAAYISDLPPSLVAQIMPLLTTQKAANIISVLETGAAAEIVDQLQTSTAAAIMNLVQTQAAAKVLAATQATQTLAILSEMNTVKVADILNAAVNLRTTSVFGSYMNQLGDSEAADILLEMAPASGAKFLEAMAEDDLQEAARTVEAAVKRRLGETNPAKAHEILDKIARILDETGTQTLVEIFVEIANLPATPSTVADVLQAMDLTKVLDVVSVWISSGSLEELAEVYSYFADGYLEDVWMGMTSEERNILYPYLDAATVERLPAIGEFQVSGLQVSPATVTPGQVVTISVTVENVGSDAGMYALTLRIDGTTEQTEKLSLTPGQSRTAQWTASRTQEKTYSVDVNGLTESFTVSTPSLPPAAFTVSNLQVTPATVEPGSQVIVTVSVSNAGGQSGSTMVELKVNGVVADTKTITLNPGASTTATFSVTKDASGIYTVAVGNLTGSFTVTPPPQPPTPSFPWEILVVAVVVIAAAAYVYYRRRE